MPKGEHLKGKGGVKFSSTYQPTNEAKSVPKTITTFKEALKHLGEIHKSTVGGVQLTLESNIAYVLFEKANKGDMQAIKLLIDVFGWNAPTKIAETNSKGEDINYLEIFEKIADKLK